MKHTLLVIVLFVCILDLNAAKKVNAEVTLHQQHIFPLFSEYEIWGIKSINETQDIVQVNVVIDDMSKLKKDVVMAYDIIYFDAEEVTERERDRLNNRTQWTASMRPDFFFQEYRNWPEYVVFIDYLLLTYSAIASRSYIGDTIQGRQIPIITLSTGDQDDGKPALYIQAEAHAREWLANAATMYILNALLEGYTNNDAVITEILDSINIFIVPTLNIDGYIYAWEIDRFWRKNRRANTGGSFGVDLNRNYDGPTGTWCTVGSSTTPSSNSYCGTSPYSEPEVQAVQSFVFDEKNNIGATVDMHTSGPYILFPYGYNWDVHVPQPFYDEYLVLSAAISEAIYNVHGVRYTPTQRFGPTSGTMRDYPFAISYETNLEKKMFSFTWEGRGPGFDPPASNIIPAGEE
eukprot:190353_1